MARTTEEKAKRTRDGADDAVYKPARSAKKPVRTESEKTESGAKYSAAFGLHQVFHLFYKIPANILFILII